MDLPPEFTNILTSLGLAGVVISILLTTVVVLAGVIAVLDRRNSAIQERRLQEAREGYIALKENTMALNALSSALFSVRNRRR